jgi:hypothetical protein
MSLDGIKYSFLSALCIALRMDWHFRWILSNTTSGRDDPPRSIARGVGAILLRTDAFSAGLSGPDPRSKYLNYCAPRLQGCLLREHYGMR